MRKREGRRVGRRKKGQKRKIKSHKHWPWILTRGVCEELEHLCSLCLQMRVRTSIYRLAVCQVSTPRDSVSAIHNPHSSQPAQNTAGLLSQSQRLGHWAPRPAPVTRECREQAPYGMALSEAVLCTVSAAALGRWGQSSCLHCLWRHSASNNLYSTGKQQGPFRVRDYRRGNL